MRKCTLTQWIVVTCSVAFVGCNHEPPPLPIEGVVSLDGQPLAEAQVTFQPKNGFRGYNSAAGMTDKQGRFTLTNGSGTAGLCEGEYVVTFSKAVLPNGKPLPAGAKPSEAGARELLPERYRDPQALANVITVSSSQTSFKFALSGK